MTTDGTMIATSGLWHGMEEFVAVVEHGSIRAAAEALLIPRSTVSRRLRELEASLGVELAHRTTRSFTLTKAGQLLFRRARVMRETVASVRQEVAYLDDVPRGPLRVSLPPGRGLWDAHVIDGFMDRYPEVRLEILATGRAVDLVREEVDVVVRAGEVDDDRLVGRRLARGRLVCVASTQYLEQHGRPERAEDLKEHSCLLWMREGGHPPTRAWPLYAGGTVTVDGTFASNSVEHLLAQAIRGHGIGLLPSPLLRVRTDAQLEPLLEDEVGQEASVWVLYAEHRYPLPAVRAFVEHMTTWIAANPILDG